MTSQAPTQGPTDAGLTARVLSSEWQTIETAALDVPVLTYRKAGFFAVAVKIETRLGREVWVCTDGVDLLNVTHWQPLPTPPTNPKGAA